MARKSKRQRNYKLEYQRRKARGLASGKSLAEARGHRQAADFSPSLFKPNSPLEKALKLMKQGLTQRQAAKQVGVSTERLRRFQRENTASRREGRRWIISDRRPVGILMATRGRMREVVVPHNAASDIGKHWVAINKFLETNNPAYLEPFEGLGLRDIEGQLHPFETRPNVLRRLDSIGELSFVDIYRQTVQ